MREERPRYFSIFALLTLLQAFSLGVLPKSEARNLTDVLSNGFSYQFSGIDNTVNARIFAPAFSIATSEAISEAIAQELPLASVAPAFTYRYNPTLSSFERSVGVPGPLFSERALTLGEGQLNFGVGYGFIDFSKLNGKTLDNIRSPAFLASFFLNERVPFFAGE